jgi:hypothetical protein
MQKIEIWFFIEWGFNWKNFDFKIKINNNKELLRLNLMINKYFLKD